MNKAGVPIYEGYGWANHDVAFDVVITLYEQKLGHLVQRAYDRLDGRTTVGSGALVVEVRNRRSASTGVEEGRS